MFNLLPDDEKSRIITEYRVRRNAVAASFVLALGLIGMISILPSLIISETKASELESAIASAEQALSGDSESLDKSIAVLKQKVALLDPAKAVLPTEGFAAVAAVRGTDIRISGFSFKAAQAKEPAVISIEGIAATRNGLSDFVERLRQTGRFEKVDLPVSNLAKDRNSDFSITATLKN
jgi:Tfp pilus assembly protein PilN